MRHTEDKVEKNGQRTKYVCKRWLCPVKVPI